MAIIGGRINKQEQLIKRYEKKQSDSDDLAQSFLEESWRRDIDKLKREEMRELMVNFLSMIKQLSEQIEILVGRKPEYIKLIEESLIRAIDAPWRDLILGMERKRAIAPISSVAGTRE